MGSSVHSDVIDSLSDGMGQSESDGRAVSVDGVHDWLKERLLVGSLLVLLHTPLLTWLRDLWSAQGLSVAQSIVTPFVIAGLLYLRRDSLKGMERPLEVADPMGWWLMLTGASLAVVAAVCDVVAVSVLSAPLCVHGYLVWTRGRARVAQFVQPLYLMLFLVPGTYGELGRVSFYLQLAAAQVATWVLQLVALPTWRDGVVVVTGATTNTVTEDCSGMATFVALALYALVFGLLVRMRARDMVKVLSGLMPIAMLANGLRVAAISILLYHYGEDVANGPWHNGVGYILFGLCYVWLFVAIQTLSANKSQNHEKKPTHQRPVTL